MNQKTNLFITVTPSDARVASSWGVKLAHLAYEIGSDLTLKRGQIVSSMRGGLMVLSDASYLHQSGRPEVLCDEIARECVSMDYLGVVADFERPYGQELAHLLAVLSNALQRKGLVLYTTPMYAQDNESSRVLLTSALTSGSLEMKIAEATRQFGAHRLALDIERRARDLVLPDASGQGKTLTPMELSQLTAGRQVFFSRELCARYFTFKDEEGHTHFVIFDDMHSIVSQIKLAQSMGIRECFLVYPEVQEILPAILQNI